MKRKKRGSSSRLFLLHWRIQSLLRDFAINAVRHNRHSSSTTRGQNCKQMIGTRHISDSFIAVARLSFARLSSSHDIRARLLFALLFAGKFHTNRNDFCPHGRSVRVKERYLSSGDFVCVIRRRRITQTFRSFSRDDEWSLTRARENKLDIDGKFVRWTNANSQAPSLNIYTEYFIMLHPVLLYRIKSLFPSQVVDSSLNETRMYSCIRRGWS